MKPIIDKEIENTIADAFGVPRQKTITDKDIAEAIDELRSKDD